ncbi:MAG TPA: hypothetical protein VH144_01230 [Candidatus Saccharimonadales bacterium]|jgi:hypothetical protein|nr:hypothetical protein [Candidatus Saccharimonadales bacterium]
MSGEKFILWTIVTILGFVGGYIPVWLWQADPLGLWSILGGLIGGILGIWLWFRFVRS